MTKHHRKIGGTDISKLCGLSPYGGPHSVYARIVEGVDAQQNQAMRRGKLLEPVVRQMYVEDVGAELLPHPGILASPRYDFAVASVDDLAALRGEDRVAEYKSASLRTIADWGDEGTDEVPMPYLVQCAWYLMVTDLPVADLAVLIAGDTFRCYRIRRDLELESSLLETAERFWVNHVLRGVPPPPDGSEDCTEALRRRYPKTDGSILSATPEDNDVARRYWEARRAREMAEQLETDAKNKLIARIGSADGLHGDGWRISYRTAKGSTKTDWEAVAREAGAPEHLIQRHTRIGSGGRRFLPTFQDGGR